MNVVTKIKVILMERNMTVKALSEKMGFNSRYLYNKFSRNNLTLEDLYQIAEALNCEFDGVFTMNDTGKKI